MNDSKTSDMVRVTLDSEAAVLHYYSTLAHDIYEKRTAGDFTWTGLLAMTIQATERVRQGATLVVADQASTLLPQAEVAE